MEDIDRIVTRRDLQQALGVCRETMRLWEKAGKLPPYDVDMSRQSRGWRASTLQAAGINVPLQPQASQPTPEPLAA